MLKYGNFILLIIDSNSYNKNDRINLYKKFVLL